LTGAPPVRAWVDPSCPWCWQTTKWLLGLREGGLLTLSWSLFSLELNASPAGTPFEAASERYGEALLGLALARREGPEVFERLFVALGERLHERKDHVSPALVREAATEAGRPGLIEQALSTEGLADEITREFHAARDGSVFGVPTLKIGEDKVIYGPMVAVTPAGDAAIDLWDHVRGLSARPDFFELKRWPRDVRPGGGATGSTALTGS